MKPAVAINFVLFNGVWFACVLGAAADRAWIGLLALAGFAAWQLAVGPHRGADLRLLAIAAGIGFVIDTVYVQTGIVRYAAPAPSPATAPWWIMALWMNFALTLNHSLEWLQPRPWLASVFGLLGGPLAYYAGIRLGAVTPEVPLAHALAVFAVAWALVTPLLTALAGWSRTGPFTQRPAGAE